MRNIIGRPVSGENFALRDKVLRKTLRLMENGNSFLLSGIRKTGKSSLLQQTAYWLKKNNNNNVCIEIKCATYDNTLDFYEGIYDELPNDIRTQLKKLLEDSKEIPKKFKDFFLKNFKEISYKDLKLKLRDEFEAYHKPFVNILTGFFRERDDFYLFFDELPFMFENLKEKDNVHEITMLLAALREWRDEGIPMGIAGSLNIYQQLEAFGISRKLLGGLNSIKLKPFTRSESEKFIQELLKGKNYSWWDDEVTGYLLDILPDYLPYFLQYSFNQIVLEECKTKNEIEEVFHNEIMPGLFRDFIYQFEERLKIFTNENLKKAMGILDFIAQNGETTQDAIANHLKEDFDYKILLKLITNEFLTVSGDHSYEFELNIIKNWWKDKRNIKL